MEGRFLPALLLLFFGSGCAALMYEIIWLQLLQLVIGLTTASLGILLGTFMGGMCLGSLALPRVVSARRHPLRVYALLELGIGLIGVAVVYAVPWLGEIYASKAGAGWSGILVRSLLAAVCLVPPTLLMGATLPAIARWVESTPRGASCLGLFYGGNIAGAVCGCLLAGFYLLRVHNAAVATYVAATINVSMALAAFGLASRTAHVEPVSGAPADDGHRVRGPWGVYGAIALSGMAALGAEVVWTRLLSLLLGATVYTFSIILAIFLLGLGLGSAIGAFLSRSLRHPGIALAGAQVLAIGSMAWAAHMITRSLPYWPINPALAPSPWYLFQLDLAICGWVVLPAAVCWGASFPLALAAVTSPNQDAGRTVGGVYAANTIGAIIGALGFSLMLVPLVGTQWAQRVLIVLPALSVLLLLTFANRPIPVEAVSTSKEGRGFAGRLRTGVACVAVIVVAVLLALPVAPIPWGVVAYGRFAATYLNRLAPGIVPEREVPSGVRSRDTFCTYVGEGLNGTVAVTKLTSGVRTFHSAGKAQASSDPRDMRLQRLLGHLSALAHPKPESVLVVACGAGVTAGAFVTHPDVKRIVICDIEPLVPKFVTPMFERENHGVLKDPRTQVVLDDGRHFLRTTKEKFDIITSDPIDPWVKGCAALNTLEYYDMCKRHLKPGGVMSLWIPLYESDAASAKSMIATFFKAFPNGAIWSNDSEGDGYDAVLFGQVEPTRINVDDLQERLNRPDHSRVKQSLAQVSFYAGVDLLATYAGQAGDLRDWLRDAQINTDHNLRLQYLAGMALNSSQSSELLSEIHACYKFPSNLFVGSDRRLELLKFSLEGPASGK